MRTIRIDPPRRDHPWLWLATGAVLGVAVGVLVADRRNGRRSSLRGLVGRGRRFATTAMRQWGPLLETVGSIRGLWDAPDADEDEAWAEEEGIEEPTAAAEPDDDEAEEEEDEDEAPDDEGALDARVLEAFSNDPVLARRAVEIDSPREGVIVLYGRVRSDREVKHAVTLARGVPGVVRVRERLTVRERPR